MQNIINYVVDLFNNYFIYGFVKQIVIVNHTRKFLNV